MSDADELRRRYWRAMSDYYGALSDRLEAPAAEAKARADEAREALVARGEAP
jgi:hypothetical protein